MGVVQMSYPLSLDLTVKIRVKIFRGGGCYLPPVRTNGQALEEEKGTNSLALLATATGITSSCQSQSNRTGTATVLL